MSLELKNVSKMYNGSIILRDVSLQMRTGETYFLIGASGSGKTTLLRLIAELETPSGGQIETDGACISYAFQEHRLFPHLTVLENILAISPARQPEEILSLLDLTEAADKYPHQLSGGMKKRAGVARALAAKADIYLLDEPTAGQDAAHGAAVAEAIRRYTAGALTVIATHDESLLRSISGSTLHVENQNCSAVHE